MANTKNDMMKRTPHADKKKTEEKRGRLGKGWTGLVPDLERGLK